MTQVKISELEKLELQENTFVPVEQSGKNGKVDLATLKPKKASDDELGSIKTGHTESSAGGDKALKVDSGGRAYVNTFVAAENDNIFAGEKKLPAEIIELVKGSTGKKHNIVATASYGGWNAIGMVLRNSSTYTYTQLTAGTAGVLVVTSANFNADGTMVGEVKSFSLNANGDGTKALMDDGSYKELPKQERGGIIYSTSSIFGSVDDDPAVFLLSASSPSDVTPVENRDYVLYSGTSGKYLFRITRVTTSGSAVSMICERKYRIQL